MPTSIEDVIILLDAQLMDAPVEIRDDWRRVRGHLRQRRRPTGEQPALPDTGKHFRAVTEILDGVNRKPGEPV